MRLCQGLRRRKVTGAEALIGETGVVTEALTPQGMIKIKERRRTGKQIPPGIQLISGNRWRSWEFPGLYLK